MKKQHNLRSIWYFLAGIVWFIINIRVEAGWGSPLEKTIDGMAGGLVLLVTIYYGGKFFDLFDLNKRKTDSSG